MKRRGSCLPTFLILSILLGLVLLLVVVVLPAIAWDTFGAPSSALTPWQRLSYGVELVLHSGDLTQPRDLKGIEQAFTIQPGESVNSISSRLEQTGLIRNARSFRAYLIWTGLDTIMQTGTYQLTPAQSGEEIAQSLKSTSLTDVKFNILAGWRMEEIADSLSTSGLEASSEAFLAAASQPVSHPDFLPDGASAEGFLTPGVYTLPRSTTAEQLVFLLLQNSSTLLTPDLRADFSNHDLSIYQAVTMASIIQREVLVDDEMPMIASVFYNRLAIDMALQTDPTVQYALGYNRIQRTWWTNPLSMVDLEIDSPYNTYIYKGLPPGPISNPGMAALKAVAFPAESKYYYFQARCDSSGLHNFAETLEQHQQNNCP